MTDVLDRPTSPSSDPANGTGDPTPDQARARRPLRERVRSRTLVHTDRGRALVIGVGTVVVLLVAVVALTVGGAGIGLGDALTALGRKATGTVPADPDGQRILLQVWDLRVPRVLLALLAGAALAVAGVLFQGLLRNPLVSPYTLGIAPAAAFGAAFAILFVGPRDLGSSGGVGWVVVGALTVALLSSVLVLLLGAVKRGDPATLILLGIAVTQFFTAATSALQYTADQETLALIIQWTWGSVNGAEWFQVGVVALLVAIVFPLVQRQAGNVNAIAFAGDDAATSLGVPVARVRLGLIFTAVVITAVTIAFTGIIGFVGLVGPHIARLLIGGNHRFLLPFSMLTGGLLLVVADSVGRVALEPAVMPVGIVDALVGAPIFLYLILARRRAAA
ncbi:FecCD family ABC transporter permease [Cellulomonas palmilytica]|uniref:FecCD family ABC transporter permease n=1 Tax=Cellulomonas palmilytica TaxID=2608402 RepID=UPI001F4182D4|nr:iron ABC transporter permease [Cellulomonas palmilytica]UJP39965.1 iron ABC transporter permease [Cellulomonas palmilytica]